MSCTTPTVSSSGFYQLRLPRDEPVVLLVQTSFLVPWETPRQVSLMRTGTHSTCSVHFGTALGDCKGKLNFHPPFGNSQVVCYFEVGNESQTSDGMGHFKDNIVRLL